jgi:uncharacterized membrane protein
MGEEAALALLLATVAGVLWLESFSALAPLFRRLPAVIWVYLLPMLWVQLGWVPPQVILNLKLSTWLLPPALVLLLLGADMRGILRLGFPALISMAGSILGVILGAIVAFAVFHRLLGPEVAEVFAGLGATWIGGSVNLLAVGEALQMSPRSQGMAIVVDSLVAYSWMAGLLALAAYQEPLDRFFRVERKWLSEIRPRMAAQKASGASKTGLVGLSAAVALAFGISALARQGALKATGALGGLEEPAWTVLLVTSFAVLLSLTPARRFVYGCGESFGQLAFYLLLASVGARADFSRLREIPMWLLAGLVVLVVHGIVLGITLRLFRLPSFFFGTASQAAVGGYVSAPLVAESYQRGFGSVGLLLAILGNLVGTYVGVFLGLLFRQFVR